MAVIREIKCANGAIARIHDDYLIRDPEELRKAKAQVWRTACRIWDNIQERKAAEGAGEGAETEPRKETPGRPAAKAEAGRSRRKNED